MRVIFTDGIHFDVFRVINIYELFIDVRAIRSRVVERRIKFTRFIANLSPNTRSEGKKEYHTGKTHLPKQAATASTTEINVYIVIFSAHGLFDERFLQNFPVDYDGITVVSEKDFRRWLEVLQDDTKPLLHQIFQLWVQFWPTVARNF